MATSKQTLPALAVSTVCSVGLIGLIAPTVAFAQSFVRLTTPAAPSDLVSPAAYDVLLEPDDPLTVPVNVRVAGAPSALDVFLLEDLSGSFGDDISTVQRLVPNLVSSLQTRVPNTQFGVGSFVDKPVNPFGDSGSGDYVYETNLPITPDTTALQTAVNNLTIRYGTDIPEAQIEALLQTAVRSSSEIGFRDEALKVVVLSTDAPFHQAGDFPSAPPNDGDADLEGIPPGTGEDFPSVAQVRSAISAVGIIPIFAVTPEDTSTYEALVDDLGVGTVVELNSDSSNLVEAVTAGLEDVVRDITLVPESDDFDYVSSITPDVFNDVPPGETRTFDVTLLADGSDGVDTLSLVAPGFGTTEVRAVPEPLTIIGSGMALGFGALMKRQYSRKRKQI